MQDLHSTSYLPRAKALNPSGRRQPVPDRTLGAQGLRPGGAINPRGEAASTFGNTGKHRPGPDPDRATGAPPPPFEPFSKEAISFFLFHDIIVQLEGIYPL